MTRPLRVGDRVTATGMVTRIAATMIDPEIVCAVVSFDGDRYDTGEGTALSLEALTLVEPVEPPVGSVVVKDGVAWCRSKTSGWYALSVLGSPLGHWTDLCDGEVIFTPGGEA